MQRSKKYGIKFAAASSLLTVGLLVIGWGSAAGVTAKSRTPGTPQPVRFYTDGQIIRPGTIIGTWHATGAISDSGTYSELFRLDGTGTVTIHTEKTLTSATGSIVLDANGIVEPISRTEVTFRAGAWEIHGTGAYATLHGHGTPAAEGTANLATGVVHTLNTGSAHFDPAP
jgi:hypothetical protein